MSFHPEGSNGGKGDDIMSTHFLIEEADTGSYRDQRGIKGELWSLCFSPLCCLLLFTVPSGGDGNSRLGPLCRMGPSAAVTGMLLSWWRARMAECAQGKRRRTELPSELHSRTKNSKSEASFMGSMSEEGHLRGKWINVFSFSILFSFILFYVDALGNAMSGLCRESDHRSRSPSVSTWKHRGATCIMQGQGHQR